MAGQSSFASKPLLACTTLSSTFLLGHWLASLPDTLVPLPATLTAELPVAHCTHYGTTSTLRRRSNCGLGLTVVQC